MMNMPVILKRCLYLIVINPLFCCAQIADDFSDGNFSSNPEWLGDIAEFKVNSNFELQLNDNKESSSCLFTGAVIDDAMEWRCWVRQSFSPSGNNHSRVYLSAETACGADPPDGIFLQFGESGSLDAIRLMEQDNGDTNTLIRGMQGAISSSFRCAVKVIFEDGLWSLFADHEGGNDYNPEGTAFGNLLAGDAFIGVVCKYTISNSTNFYFDDFYAGPIVYDTIPPSVIHVSVNDPKIIEIQFSENLDSLSANNHLNYFLSHGLGHPQRAEFSNDGLSVVALVYADSIFYGALMELDIMNVSDLSGNIMQTGNYELAWYYPKRYDVVINEIMADPSPPLNLPEYEYLELYNTSALPLDLSYWTLVVGTAEKSLTGLVIGPQDYVIVGKEEAKNDFMIYGRYYGLESFSLVNSGQEIMLNDHNGEIIHGLYYDQNWYQNSEKSDGGWSLEQIDPHNPCLTTNNWQASANINGGTPGRKNSVFDEMYLAPKIIKACVADSVRIRIIFNQSMGRDITLDPGIFQFDHGAGPAGAILPDDAYFTSFMIYPGQALLPGKIYTMTCRGTVSNCVGDSFNLSENILIGLPRAAAYNDLVINEVLFNPFPGGADYVELYNRSEKALDLTGLILASVKNNPPSPPDTNFVPVDIFCSMLMPGEYVFLCNDFDKVNAYYSCSQEKNFLELDRFPSYSNESGTVVLMDAAKNLIDAFSYHEDMHYPLLNTAEGVSLERIHFNRPATDRTNWHSASQLSGFGTPGYENSQYSDVLTDKGKISVQPKVFAPGNNGQANYTNIFYAFERPGYLATIMIFDANGYLCRHLVNNELLGTSGSYSWDGINEDRQKASAGIYIVLAELLHPDGNIMRFKETVVVAL